MTWFLINRRKGTTEDNKIKLKLKSKITDGKKILEGTKTNRRRTLSPRLDQKVYGCNQSFPISFVRQPFFLPLE